MGAVSARSDAAHPIRRPRYARLDGAISVGIGALGVVEITVPPGAARVVLRCGIALDLFAAMALWARQNGAALDQQDWCECAAATVTRREIRSGEEDEAWVVSSVPQ